MLSLSHYDALSQASGEAMRRREFITLLCGAVVWPLAARAQQPERMRRIGILLAATADDAEFQRPGGPGVPAGAGAIGLDHRPQRADRHPLGPEPMPAKFADTRRNWSRSPPDVILASGGSTVGIAAGKATRTVPIVFPIVSDPVAGGFVESLARPGGNATGFMLFEYSFSGKWLELLKQIAPGVTRAAVLRIQPGSRNYSLPLSRPWLRRSRGGKPRQRARPGEIERHRGLCAHSE